MSVMYWLIHTEYDTCLPIFYLQEILKEKHCMKLKENNGVITKQNEKLAGSCSFHEVYF